MGNLICNIGKQFVNENIDVRSKLKNAFLVGASVEEACVYAGVPIRVFRDWEYTYNELSNIIAYMYSNKIKSYKDIDITEDIGNNDIINIELVKRLQKNDKFGLDVYTLIKQCKEAQSEVVILHLSTIRQPKKRKDGDWKASAWFLERTNPARYGRKDADAALENAIDTKTTKITVEYIDPKSADERLKAMEELVKAEIEGKK